MIATLTLLIVFQAEWNLPALYPTYILNPTGANGMEDYTLAMDLLRAGHFNAYDDWQSPQDRLAGPPPGLQGFRGIQKPIPDPKYIELVNRLDGLNLLQLRQEEASKFGKALDLVASGNSKSFAFVTPTSNFKFPVVSDVIDLARLGDDSSYTALSEANGTLAVDDISRVLVMSDRLARHNYFSILVSTYEEAHIFAAISENLNRYSIDDAKSLEIITDAILKLPAACIESLHNEMANARNSTREVISTMRSAAAQPSNDKQEQAISRMVSSLSDSDIEAMTQRVLQAMSDRADVAFARLNGPEENWLSQSATEDPGPVSDVPKSLSDLENLLAWYRLPPFARNASTLLGSLKSRTQLRLARLHSRIIHFNWEWGRFPKNLEELNAPKDYTFDRLSSQPFVYELTPEGYRLYSKGWKQSGPIFLDYNFPGSPRMQGVAP